MMEMIRALSVTSHRVTFVPADLTGHAGYLENLQAIGVEVIHRPYYNSIVDYLRQHGREFDLAIISRPSIAASHMTTVRRLAPRAKIVFDTVDLHFVRERRQASVTGDDSLESAAATRKHQELQLASRADLTLVVSPVEKEILETECPGIDVRILATIHHVDDAQSRDSTAGRTSSSSAASSTCPIPTRSCILPAKSFRLCESDCRTLSSR